MDGSAPRPRGRGYDGGGGPGESARVTTGSPAGHGGDGEETTMDGRDHRPGPRGKLKIHLGAAPGVGKTCAMLAEAHRLRTNGSDVVAGIIEDHGRAHTRAMAEGLETIPRLPAPEGSAGGELDVDAVIARHPDVVLVDEFAHSNPQGSPHAKRWGDVAEILDAGIDVISTMNIQHLESLNDVVGNITGVVQRETVPDTVVRAADEIELVDLSPEFLRTRLAEGLVYRPERIGPALNNYFRLGNLTALRELALLWLADQVDDALARYRAAERITDTWETRERVVVAVSDERDAEPLIRRGRRIAAKSSAELMVVHVIGGDGFTSGTLRTMPRVRELASDLDADIHQVTGDSVPEALLQFARGANATQLVLGTSRRSRWARLLREGTANAVVRGAGRIDVHLVTLADGASGSSRRPAPPGRRQLARWAPAILAPAFITFLAHLVEPAPGAGALGGIASLFFAVILAVSLLCGMWPALLCALLSGLALNWYFTPPVQTFTISDPANAMTLGIMLATALAVALLVDRARAERDAAAAASREADLLALFSRTALSGGGPEALLENTGKVFGHRAVTAITEDGALIGGWSDGEGVDLTNAPLSRDEADAVVESSDDSVALLLAGSDVRADDRGILSVVADHLAGLVRQAELSEEASRAGALAEADELRRALLSAVGHDLRTPLASAKVSVSALRATDVEFSDDDRAELLETIEVSVDQLSRLVANLLDSSRLAAGAIRARLEDVPLEEVAHRAVADCAIGRSRAEIDRVRVDGPALASVVAVADRSLLERVLANLVDNALSHAPGSPIEVTGEEIDGFAVVTVADRGPGLDSDGGDIWAPFQRLGDNGPAGGVGLGLSVVSGFTEAMGGSVELTGRPGGGAVARITLPAADADRSPTEDDETSTRMRPLPDARRAARDGGIRGDAARREVRRITPSARGTVRRAVPADDAPRITPRHAEPRDADIRAAGDDGAADTAEGRMDP